VRVDTGDGECVGCVVCCGESVAEELGALRFEADCGAYVLFVSVEEL
jgi:hypothetical protein